SIYSPTRGRALSRAAGGAPPPLAPAVPPLRLLWAHLPRAQQVACGGGEMECRMVRRQLPDRVGGGAPRIGIRDLKPRRFGEARQRLRDLGLQRVQRLRLAKQAGDVARIARDRKSTRLNSSHVKISYAVFCL